MNMTIHSEATCIRLIFTETPDTQKDSLFYEIDSFLHRIKTECSGTEKHILFDLSALGHIESSMISLVVQTLRFTDNSMCSLLVTSPIIEDIMIALGMNSMCTLYTKIDDIPFLKTKTDSDTTELETHEQM